MLRAIADHHFDGRFNALASHVRRNKSVVSTWLSGGSRPGWDSLCDLSFAFQIPLSGILLADLGAVKISMLQTLPGTVCARQGAKRKSPNRRDPALLHRYLEELIDGLHPTTRSLADAAARINIDVRTLYLLDSQTAKRASAVLAGRRAIVRAEREAIRRQSLMSAVHDVAIHLTAMHLKPTRRLVHAEIAKRGYALRREEGTEMLSRVIEAMRHLGTDTEILARLKRSSCER
jgi:hypothetical protein